MKNKNDIEGFEENAILNSLGLLSGEYETAFNKSLKVADSESKKLIKKYNNLTSLVAGAFLISGKDTFPSPDIKDKIMEKIYNSDSKNKNGFEFVLGKTDDWMQHPEIEGIKIKRLAYNEDKGYLMILMKAAAGTEYPAHHHNGAEECYVLEGDLFVEGKYLGPGDFHHAEGDSDHDPLRTRNGCTLLLVVDPKDY